MADVRAVAFLVVAGLSAVPVDAADDTWASALLSNRHDVFGGAAWSGQRCTLGLGPFAGIGQDGRRDQTLAGGEVAVETRSGYAFSQGQPTAGWLYSVAAAAGAWSGTGDATYLAVAPRLAVGLGLWAQLSRDFRVELVPAVGAGLVFTQLKDAPRGIDEAAYARPFASLGCMANGQVTLNGGGRIGAGLGYLHLGTPFLRPSGVVFAVFFGWER
jgi:hypothetical protein